MRSMMRWNLYTLSIYLIYSITTTLSYTMNNPAITNLAISLGGMQGMYLCNLFTRTKLTISCTKAPFERPTIHRILANCLRRIPGIGPPRLLLHHLDGVSTLSCECGGQTDSQIRRRNDLTVLKYVNPPSATVSNGACTCPELPTDPQDPEGKPELVTTTVKDYDLAETGKAMKSLFMGVAMMCFLVSRT
jgi:hypothetical protein